MRSEATSFMTSLSLARATQSEEVQKDKAPSLHAEMK